MFSHKFFFTAIALILPQILTSARAQSTTTMPSRPFDSATIPAPRTDANSILAHQQLLAKARAGGIDLYFLGDSITRRWGCTDPQWSAMLQNWNQNFFGWNAADFGWGADRIQNILWRIENGELDNVNPKVIVLLAGTNNVGTHPGNDQKIADIVNDYQTLLAACRAKAPDAKIIITAIFPRNDNPAVVPEIVRINDQLKKFADNGKLFPGMTVDKLHPTVKGYQIWADALRPLLTQLLGPRSSTDHAPPPTGDPSALHLSAPR
jgi:lysophospholipase L1-like esterase